MPPSASHSPLSPLNALAHAGYVWGNRPAVRWDGWRITYRELADRVGRVAGALAADGIAPGDRVAALLPNVPELLELHFAAPAAGAVLVPVSVRVTAAELAYILEHSGARIVFTHPGLEETARAALGSMADPPRMILTRAGAGDTSAYEDMLAASAPAAIAAPDDETALLTINYTSGTTGRPKGVMYSHRGAYVHALGVIAEAQLDTRSAYLWTLPMFHCNGWAFTWAVTAMGGEHRCVARFDPGAVWGMLAAGEVSHFCGAPTVLTMLASDPAAAPVPREVKAFVGGAPPSPALLRTIEDLGIRVTHLYGLTETYGPIAVCAWQPAWDELDAPERMVMRSHQGVGTVVSEPLRVVDADGRDVPADGETIGEIIMRGNNVALGYYRDEATTAAAFRDGWFHSGDLAVMHPDGYVEIRDRLKDMIISGGENISSIEVEHALAAHPDVIEAAVVGIAHDLWGEVPKAYVVAREGAAVDADELREFASGRLARFKVPKAIEVVDALPKTATGKVQKHVLRERARGEAGGEVVGGRPRPV
jgi:acyl-CoA synthetase (AMP-forming)/AMP-acid ligase II